MTRDRLVALEALLQRPQADHELVGELRAMKDREGERLRKSMDVNPGVLWGEFPDRLAHALR